MIRMPAIVALLVITFSANLLGEATPQTLSKCTVQKKQLILPKGRSLRLTGTALGRTSVEYHVTPKVDTSIEFKLTTANHLNLSIYLLDPPTAISKASETWSGTLSKGNEYTLAVNNCSGRTSTKFQIDVKPH